MDDIEVKEGSRLRARSAFLPERQARCLLTKLEADKAMDKDAEAEMTAAQPRSRSRFA